jgi:hypothetical protein
MPFTNLESILNKADKSANHEESSITKLSFAYRQFNDSYLPENTHTIRELDLTENNFTGATDIRFLINFPNLQTLILDKNCIQSNFNIPKLDSLTTLCVNDNKIENLEIFISHLQDSCANLTYLSMLKNKAAPSYFNGGSLNEYNDYRLYVISKLPKLKMLDDKEITLNERSQAKALYGTTMNSTYQRRLVNKTKVKQNKSIEAVKKVNQEEASNTPLPSSQPHVTASFLPDFHDIQSQSHTPPPPPPPLEALPQPPVPKNY